METKEDILEAVKKLKVMDLVELVAMMEKEFNVSAAAAVAPVAVAAAAAPAEEEKTEFDVSIKSAGDNKINVIKAVRAITGLGLKEAKDLVEGAPAVVKSGVSKEEAAKMKKELEDAGATVEIK